MRLNKRHLCRTFNRFLLTSFLVGALWFPSSHARLNQVVKTSSARANLEFQPIAPGIEYLRVVRRSALNEAGNGPWLINALRVDLKMARLQLARALDEGVGLETVSSLAARHKAVAATNAGYFRTTGTYRGESVGTFLLGGKLFSEPHNDRAALGLTEANGVVFGRLKFFGEISAGKMRFEVSGFNRPLADNELVIFTPEFHRTTLTGPEVLEVVVDGKRVVLVRDHRGSNEIPVGGFVIAATGRLREQLLKNLRKGSLVNLSWRLEPFEQEQSTLWHQAHNIVGGGPQLIKGGKVAITNTEEKIVPAFVADRHPRTAIARLSSGEVLLLTVDGRQPAISVGMSLPGLAELLLEFGAVEAINLDGGGSTTMVVRNKIVNHPSDQTGERPVSDAILVFTR